MKILLVEDDAKAARLLVRGLEEEGFAVDPVASAEAAMTHLGPAYHLIILDWMLPGMDGISLCRELRAMGVTTPVLMLTARDAVGDRIAGLNTGADDYLTKPFVFEELLARVRSLLRRAALAHPRWLKVADLAFDPHTHAVTRAGAVLDLTPKEYALLEFLARHVNELVGREQLAQHVWHADLIAIDNLIDVHMRNLRRKVDQPGLRPLIQTVRGRGFRLVGDGENHA